ncbi:MAG TPA: lysine--tRNA ligase [Ilumatobacter sp.]|nr:lysine--tRNA ligase [Ilumatobacter sp.]
MAWPISPAYEGRPHTLRQRPATATHRAGREARRYGLTIENEPIEAAAIPDGLTAAADETIAEISTGSGLIAEKARRLGRVAEIRDSGVEPYPYRFDRSHTLADVRGRWGDLEPGTETDDSVTIAGRLLLKRDTGKLIFGTVRDRGDEVQLFISKAVIGDAGFDDAKQLDLGDWVGVLGTVMTTRKGELSVKVTQLELLAKAVRPLPDKWRGLTDVDTRFRQRYADLIVNEEARRHFEIRHATVSSFRRTLDASGFIEVETPVLHVEAGGALARPFITHHNTLDMDLYLRIALELHLKRLIVGGMERVYEIGRIFRNEGISTRHNPEFTMMELYQAFGDWTDVMAITELLITNAAIDALGTSVLTIRGEQVDLAEPWPRLSMCGAVAAKLEATVHPSCPVEDMRSLADGLGIGYQSAWGSGRVIEAMFEHLCESEIVRPTFVTGHPVEISPLSRVDRNDPFITERFELFVDGRELANGYSELNDPVEQRARFEDEQAAKEAGDSERGTVDEDYLRALEYGMPPTGGLGVGIDRVVMLLAGVDSIKEVILFPTLRPEAN